MLGGATSRTLPFHTSSPNSLIRPLSQGWSDYLPRAEQGEASHACNILHTGSTVAGGIGTPCYTPADSQHLPSPLSDDSDYEDTAWEEELARPTGEMAKVGPTMGLEVGRS